MIDNSKQLKAVIFLCITLFTNTRGFCTQDFENVIIVLANSVITDLKAAEKKKVAVIDFTDLDNQVTTIGKLVSEELINQLFEQSKGSLVIVERKKIHEIFNEQERGRLGLLESQHIDKFAKVLGVDAILTGTVTPIAEKIRINARLIGVPSGEIFATASGSIKNDGYGDGDLQSANNKKQEAHQVSSRTLKNIQYNLTKCVINQSTLEVHLAITSKDERNLYSKNGITSHGFNTMPYIYGKDANNQSYLYDSNGGYYAASLVSIGDKAAPRVSYAPKYETPINAIVYFQQVNPNLRSIKKMGIMTSHGLLEFNNIQITK